MTVYKDGDKWRVIYRFTNWKGERKQTQKRGFATKREAQMWEREIMLKQEAKLDMTFESFFEIYEADKKKRVKENTWESKSHVIRTKILPYFRRNVKDTEGIILHSDLGSQYTSQLFEDYMAEHKFQHSFSRKGNPYDNACIESFHAVMKKEEIYLHEYQDFEEAKSAIFGYIESWYNRKRIHSALGYKTPQQVEDEAVQVA